MIKLQNDDLEVEICCEGVKFVSIKTRKDNINNITSYKDRSMYHQDYGAYLGALVGPLAGRTQAGSYGLDLDINNPPNHLHGGSDGLSHHVFDVTQTKTKAIFTKEVADVFYEITIELEALTIHVDLKARPKKEAVINLTYHPYFNLSGENHLENHSIQMDCEKVSYLNEQMLNTNRLEPVEGSIFDFNQAKDIFSFLSETHPQFDITRHLDHSFKTQSLILKTKDKQLHVQTTTPFIHLYLANYFDENFVDEKNRPAKNHASLAIEPLYLPNDPQMKKYDASNPYHEQFTLTFSFDKS